MPVHENVNPADSAMPRQDALQLGPRRKAYVQHGFQILINEAKLLKTCFNRRSTDPLVHSGRHFGRTIHALCNVHALINNGIIRMGERADEPEEAFTDQ